MKNKKKGCGCGAKKPQGLTHEQRETRLTQEQYIELENGVMPDQGTPPTQPLQHNEHYYETGRNGWTPSTTLPIDDANVEITNSLGTLQNVNPEVTAKAEIPEDSKKRTEERIRIQNIAQEGGRPSGFDAGLASKELKAKGARSEFAIKLERVTTSMTDLLIRKNRDYGNTALNPTNIFSKLSPIQAISARLDDKLARISNTGINDKTEDTVDDLIGYLFLLKMAMNEEK